MTADLIKILIYAILILGTDAIIDSAFNTGSMSGPGLITPLVGTVLFAIIMLTKSRHSYASMWEYESQLHGSFQETIKLERKNQKFKSLINTIRDFIVITDRRGGILFSNSRAWEFTGITMNDIIGMNILSFIHFEESEKIPSEEDDIIELIEGEKRIIKEDGTEFWVSLRTNPLPDESLNNSVYIINIREIADLKEKEIQLQIAKEFSDEANQAKSRFLANISHELRTPLSSILGYSQFLRMAKIGPLNETQDRYIDCIARGGEHLLEMVNDILDLSKIEAGKIKIEKKLFDLNLMLSRSPSTIKAIADKKKVDMILNIQENLGFINADEVRIKQVIFNLLSNAINFTEPGRKVGIDAIARSDKVVISVWDEGCGIPEENLARIFEPFEQSENTKNIGTRGTGLGLSISKKLIELHGGTLTVTSKIDSGSHFVIILPERKEAEQYTICTGTASAIDIFSNYAEGIRIMLIEDNEIISDLLGNILRLSGYDMVHFKSGEDAIEYIRRGNCCDLIICDIALAGIDGIKTMNTLKQLIKKKIPYIALTGYAMKGDRDRFIRAGFSDYISKPFKIESLLSTLSAQISPAGFNNTDGLSA